MFAKNKFICLVLTCLLVLVSGCGATTEMYQGMSVSPEQVIVTREHTPSQGMWETFDLTIEYEYLQDGSALEMTGEIALGEHYQEIYTRLVSLQIFLLFVDESSRVLETDSFIVNVWNRRTDETFRFSRFFKMPTGTAGFSFGYLGEVHEEDGNTTFYYMSLRQR